MATKAEKNVTGSSIQRDENKIAHNYFEQTAVKDWKVVSALAYYIKQNVPVQEAYTMIEIALQNAIKSRKKVNGRGQAILDELNTLKAIIQGGLVPSASSSSAKVADQINNFGSITQTNSITQPGKRKSSEKSGITSQSDKDAKKDGQVLVKKPKTSFAFSPPLTGQLLTINKPRLAKDDASRLEAAFEVIISDIPSTPTSDVIVNEYNKNIEEQHLNKCLESLPKVKNLLEEMISGEYKEMLQIVDNYKFDGEHSESEIKAIRLLKYIMNDYHANCEKPVYYTMTNERTPYCEHIIPIFKYFSAVYKNLSFMWCEKGLIANKQLAICLNDDQRKLMDGVGYSTKDKAERVLVECSGETDGDHTEEDTLKLMEATSRCLKNEMSNYKSASWTTFGNRRVLAIQSVNNTITLLSTKRVDENKWCFMEQRTAIVPRDWGDRTYWIKVMELLLKLQELLDEQESVTQELRHQQVGLIKVDVDSTIRQVLNNFTPN